MFCNLHISNLKDMSVEELPKQFLTKRGDFVWTSSEEILFQEDHFGRFLVSMVLSEQTISSE